MREAFQTAEARFDTLGETGSYNTPALGGDYRGGTIGASPAYSFTAHVVELRVDEETGRITVENCWIAHDCGRALNPMLVAGQMEGSAYMGIAEALLEDHGVNRFGLHAGPSLLDYRIPTSVDTPELHALIVESLDPEGPYGAKEAGEGPLHPSIPAIANAVFDAVGIRLKHLPFTPAKVLAALRERRAPERSAGAVPARAARDREAPC
jgi:4-hydroxybenzoyl-CoA reductase subunit alpha